MDTHYFVELDGQQFGPYELDQMREFEVLPDVLVYSTSTTEWHTADSYPELLDYLSKNAKSEEFDVDIYNAIYY